MDTKTQHGYLILADVSGYSTFVIQSELEHAHDILSELLELILKRITTIFTLSKLEGDAIFTYAPEEKLKRGETLLELIESTYAAFKDQQEAIRRRTTCQCNACRNVPSLDLKFMVHYAITFFKASAAILKWSAPMSTSFTVCSKITSPI